MNGKNVKLISARLNKGLRQFEIARNLGIHHTTYCMYENGRKLPDRETKIKIGAILGINPKDLFGNSNN